MVLSTTQKRVLCQGRWPSLQLHSRQGSREVSLSEVSWKSCWIHILQPCEQDVFAYSDCNAVGGRLALVCDIWWPSDFSRPLLYCECVWTLAFLVPSWRGHVMPGISYEVVRSRLVFTRCCWWWSWRRGEDLPNHKNHLKITSNSPMSTKKGAMLQAELTSRRFDFIFQCGCLVLSTKLLGAMADHVETSLAGLTVKLVRRATSLAKIYFAAWNMTMWWCDSVETCPGHGFSWTASSRLWTVWAVFQLAYRLRWPARSLNSLFLLNWQPDLSY